MRQLLSGNEAIAMGAWEAGVRVATGYPGTPSTEILETIAERYKSDIYCEWAPNEKVAFEVAAGAALAGARSIVTMKHVGLNVAADALMTMAYIGTAAGFVVCVADDPGMHSSQNEQDTRHYARFAKIPILEPSDSQEAKDFLILAMKISEEFKTPIILRSTTRISHSKSLVSMGEREDIGVLGFKPDAPSYVPIPLWARAMRERLEVRLESLAKRASDIEVNHIEEGHKRLGIITSGIAYQYTKEVFPEASILKLGLTYPYPDKLICNFADSVDELIVVEELDDFLEEHIRALGIRCRGKDIIPRTGELSQDRLSTAIPDFIGQHPPIRPAVADLPARPPVLCPGCPHRGVFAALRRFDVVVTGDIGCYSLGVFPPLSRIDTILCMGAGISMAHGMDKAGESKKVVGIVGDSTFFHSGITGLLDIAYNKGTSTIIVVDNRTTAMTGHQEHPGTGKTLMGESTASISIEAVSRACGIEDVFTVNPYDLKGVNTVLKTALSSDKPSLIISKANCPLRARTAVGPRRGINTKDCKVCGVCLRLGCPAIEKTQEGIHINALLCAGCGLCEQVCPNHAINAMFEKEVL